LNLLRRSTYRAQCESSLFHSTVYAHTAVVKQLGGADCILIIEIHQCHLPRYLDRINVM
jgi:hypothetical protein